MMKFGTLALSIGAGVALSSAANAQMAQMAGTGLFAEGALGVRASTTEVRDALGPGSFSTDQGEREFAGSLRAGWRGDMGMQGMNFGLSAFWIPGGEEAGRTLIPGSSIELRQWEHWGVGAEAGWKPAESTTLYARLEWHRAEFALRTITPTLNVRDEKRLDGWGYGFGVRHMIDQHAYVFVEWQQVEFERRRFGPFNARYRPHNTIGLIGAGWRF